MKLSSSKMDCFDWCEKMYKLRYMIYAKVKPSIYLEIGNKAHKNVEIFWKEYKLDLDSYSQDLHKYFKAKTTHPFHLDKDVNNSLTIYFSNFLQYQEIRIKKYIEKHGKENFTLIKNMFYPIANEKRSKVFLGKHEFAYVIDAIFFNPMGNLMVDWKTDKRCELEDFKKHIPQLNRYSSALTENPYKTTEMASLINKYIGIYFLKESKFYCVKKREKYSLEKEMNEFEEKIKKSKFKPVKKCESFKCLAGNWQCDYYPNYCNGAEN